MSFVKNDPKVINAWATYDLANSVYNLVITATIFPIYYKEVTSHTDAYGNRSDMITFLGMQFKNTALYDYAIAFAYLLIASIIPLLSGIADYGGNKKRFMKFFTYLGSSSCVMMYFFTADNLWLGILLVILACIGFSGSLVFYNAYLPEIATPDMQDKVSAKGFALGYAGSSLLLIFNLSLVLMPDIYGISSTGMATRMAFVTVGIWWALFAQIPFYYLPDNPYNKKPGGQYLLKGYRELMQVWNELKSQQGLKRFLTAFFVYSMGVQTVVLVATHFGSIEIGMNTAELITTILIIQFVAIAGSYLFSYSSKRIGNIQTLKAGTVVWALTCVAAYFIHNSLQFYAIAFCVGLVMGGIQSLSRSTYSRMLPETADHASYFSFYDVCEKWSIVCGMALFGLITDISSSMRQPVLALILFFVAGFALLSRLKRVNSASPKVA